jgi:beta-glucosidase
MKSLVIPKDFIVGTATAAYQIEGAYNEDGKGESIWDRFAHTPDKIINGDTGNIACDHYHRYKEDISLMKDLNLDAYRFSISWPRLIPEGKKIVNDKGIDFYNRLIDNLLLNGIIPYVTLYHWDLPQSLQDIGGWTSRDIAYYFSDYAGLCFEKFGDRVKNWITFNEPMIVAYIGCFTGENAPGIKSVDQMLAAVHNLCVAHGLSVQRYRDLDSKDGIIGITLNQTPGRPYSDKEENIQATKRFNAFWNEMFLDPVFYGKYPDVFSEIFCKDFSINEEDRKIITEKIDFLGVNYYFRAICKYNPSINFLRCEQLKVDNGKYGEMEWEIYPEGLCELLIWIKKRYGDLKLYITENGIAVDDKLINGKIEDSDRIDYLNDHIQAALKAKNEGVNLKGYFIWSFMDNFEWAWGFSKRLGIIYIDYKALERIPKKSAFWLKKLLEER